MLGTFLCWGVNIGGDVSVFRCVGVGGMYVVGGVSIVVVSIGVLQWMA